MVEIAISDGEEDVMGEEQTKILELLASGEINVEEASKLLEALGERPVEKHATVRFESPGHVEGLEGGEILTAISKAIAADTLGKLHFGRRVRRPARAVRGRSIDQIMSFASLGVSPGYAREMKALLSDVTGDDLVALSSVGVKPDYVEELKDEFGDDISVHDIIGLASMHVKPDYAADIKGAFDTVEIALHDIIALASLNVKPDYVEEIRDALGDDVNVHDIIGLSSLGVSAKYIEELIEAGVEDLSVDDVIQSTREDKPKE